MKTFGANLNLPPNSYRASDEILNDIFAFTVGVGKSPLEINYAFQKEQHDIMSDKHLTGF